MRTLMWTALAAGLLVIGGGAASADDVVRLGGPGVQTDIQGGTDTELIYGRYWGGGGRYYGGGARYWGGGGRYYGGYYGARYWGGGYYGHRHWGGYYGAGYRPYYYSSYYRPYYYRPAYYYTPSYYQQSYYNDCYYSPIMGDSAPTVTLQANGSQAPRTAPPVTRDSTFPYDGGPREAIPTPIPRDDVNPSKSPGGSIPLEGRLVKLPTESSIGASSVTSPEIQRLRYVTSPVRVTYPAYGEEPIVPAPRKVSTR